jgi:hypothetical protein
MSFEPWKDAPVKLVNTQASRNPTSYEKACAQFDVVNNPRYAKDAKGSYCNIYVWDCTRALNCEIPHWPEGFGRGQEMRTADMRKWMQDPHNGWRDVVKRDAIAAADFGFPVVMSWEPETPGIGHVAMLLPGGLIAQAGSVNLWKASPLRGFGSKIAGVSYFTHS